MTSRLRDFGRDRTLVVRVVPENENLAPWTYLR